MKRIVFLSVILLISVGAFVKVSATSSQSMHTLNVVDHQELSIIQAVELAFPSALKWNKDAQLLQAINIDLDKPGNSIGSNGKRKHWNISFGVPDTNKNFLVTIHDGKIDRVHDLTGEGTSPFPKMEFVLMEDVKYDSPELLKKALKVGDIYPGKEWAKGYNFILRKDTERNINLLQVVGWNRDQTEMKSSPFDALTGKYMP
ncbi:hypothetical protein [Lysinibacillus fusiformis]|uniref:hypothetical protein n=1 Tax=Lysinibacillus fusiformis TaxID=28031 RepID=UPI00046A407C|nr:hypothetical protein [Lysinibacillus fusiformis]